MFNNFFNFFDIMNNFGVPTTSKLIKQPAILKWYNAFLIKASVAFNKRNQVHR